jgi:predicted sulfurtransferase
LRGTGLPAGIENAILIHTKKETIMVRAKTVSTILLFFMLSLLAASAANAQEVPRISKDELKAKLKSPDLVLIDVRIDREYESSEWKITGAIREDPSKTAEWITKFPKDKLIVLYCA